MAPESVACQHCGWTGEGTELRRVEGDPEPHEGFLLLLDMRKSHRIDCLCPSCGSKLFTKTSLYGYEDTVFSD